MKATEQFRHMYLIQTCGENSPIGVKISWPPLIEPRRPVQHPLIRILMKFPLIVLLSISDGTRRSCSLLFSSLFDPSYYIATAYHFIKIVECKKPDSFIFDANSHINQFY